MATTVKDFLADRGDYHKLRCFQVATVIYDITYYFTHNYLERGDRTIDQMVQAARSGKQNIAEGNAAGTTSMKTCIHLTNVAKASLQELLVDYEDYLRTRQLETWPANGPKALQTRHFAQNHNRPEDYMPQIRVRTPEAICNIALVLIHQCDVLLERLIESLKKEFLEKGGVSEEMTRARLAYREAQRHQ